MGGTGSSCYTYLIFTISEVPLDIGAMPGLCKHVQDSCRKRLTITALSHTPALERSGTQRVAEIEARRAD